MNDSLSSPPMSSWEVSSSAITSIFCLFLHLMPFSCTGTWEEEALQLHVSYHCTFCYKFNSVQTWPWGTKALNTKCALWMCCCVALPLCRKHIADCIFRAETLRKLCLFYWLRAEMRSWRHQPDVIILHDPPSFQLHPNVPAALIDVRGLLDHQRTHLFAMTLLGFREFSCAFGYILKSSSGRKVKLHSCFGITALLTPAELIPEPSARAGDDHLGRAAPLRVSW